MLVVIATAVTATDQGTARFRYANESRQRGSADSINSLNPESLVSEPSQRPGVFVDVKLARDGDLRSLPSSSQTTQGRLSDLTQADHKPAFWIIDSRSIPSSMLSNPQNALTKIRLFAMDRCGRLRESNTEDWSKDVEDNQCLWLVVHGNRVDSNEAVAFMKSFRHAADHIGINGQFVLWSWPSGVMVRGIARDSRLKASRADAEASLLAAWLLQRPSQTPVVLVGYSFGARTIMRAASLVALEQPSAPVTGSAAITQPKTPRAFVLFLVAPAMDSSTFERLARQTLERGVSLKIIVTVNRSDPALRWYQHLWSHHGPKALGWQGPYCSTVGKLGQSLDTLDLTRQVGHTHRWEVYLGAPSVRRALQAIASVPIPD